MRNTFKQKEQHNLGWSDASRYRGRSQVGTVLKQAREGHQLTVEEVSATIRVRRIYLQAIEDGRYDLLPGVAYAVGFVRIYSDYLGLDTARLVDQFKAESGGQQYEDDFDFPDMVEEGNLPKGIMIALGVFMVILAAGLYWFFNHDSEKRPDDTVSSPVEQTSANVNINQRPTSVEVSRQNQPETIPTPRVPAQPENTQQIPTLTDILNFNNVSPSENRSSDNIYIASIPSNYKLAGWRNMSSIKIIERPDFNASNQAENIPVNNQEQMVNLLDPSRTNVVQIPDTSVYPRVVIKAIEPSYVYVIDTATDDFLKVGALEKNEEYVLLNDQNAEITGSTGKIIAILNGEYEIPIDSMTDTPQKVDYESLKQKGITLGIVPVNIQ